MREEARCGALFDRGHGRRRGSFAVNGTDGRADIGLNIIVMKPGELPDGLVVVERTLGRGLAAVLVEGRPHGRGELPAPPGALMDHRSDGIVSGSGRETNDPGSSQRTAQSAGATPVVADGAECSQAAAHRLEMCGRVIRVCIGLRRARRSGIGSVTERCSPGMGDDCTSTVCPSAGWTGSNPCLETDCEGFEPCLVDDARQASDGSRAVATGQPFPWSGEADDPMIGP